VKFIRYRVGALSRLAHSDMICQAAADRHPQALDGVRQLTSLRLAVFIPPPLEARGRSTHRRPETPLRVWWR
jgi:hypothetical protein